MAGKNVAEFLEHSSIAQRARVPLRVVFRRGRMTPHEISAGLRDGQLTVSGPPLCELVAGDTVVARGEVSEQNGIYYFTAEEARE
jgi:hypothetical protein